MSTKGGHVLTINGGSSSIKFALYEVGQTLHGELVGKVDRIGYSGAELTFRNPISDQRLFESRLLRLSKVVEDRRVEPAT